MRTLRNPLLVELIDLSTGELIAFEKGGLLSILYIYAIFIFKRNIFLEIRIKTASK